MELKLIIVASLLAFVAAESSDVLELTDADFDSKLATIDTALVMFYVPWCGHCKRLKPEFARASTDLKDNDPPVILVQVDCTEAGKDTCSRFGVTGYPTVKIFKGGELSSDYNGPREYNGIVKFMKSQVGPASKELKNLADTETFLAKNEVGVVYFGDGSLKAVFLKAADMMREKIRFAHVSDEETLKKYDAKDAIILFRPKVMSNKFEPDFVKYEGSEDKTEIKKFINENYHGLVGLRTTDTSGDFIAPLVIAYFNVDYVKNPKGANYWRNRVLKVAQNYKSDFTFAVANNNDFAHEIEEFGLSYVSGEKPVVCGRDAQGQKFVMKDEFSLESFESFLKQLKAGELEPFVKSEPIPEIQGNVIVAVGENFDEVVTNSGRDALVEFYAPWCGHCKKLTPIYDELGDAMAGEDVDIIKMDATANDVPPAFNVRGFPTLYWKPKSGKPVPYEGGRELDDFIKYIAQHATDELKGYTRSGKSTKDEL
ncbi:protein disulfide-isomerase A3 [Hyalella azteca]|uniref:protein disulfide-isomerase n=1 Tax=Hyalella azteca TaxID=294128 RepID=A0A8B7N5E8_HYAAZ|nr:protein disulfide-isomerase A3 [Hyalella azteca]